MLGGAAGAALVLAALWRFLRTVWTDRLRLQLQHENDQKIERLRAELQVQTDKTQKLLDAGVQKAVLVTRTHFETEFNAYKEIYAALTEVRHAIHATRPVWLFPPANETEEDRDERLLTELNITSKNLVTAHNKLVILTNNLAPFYSPEVHFALEKCVNTLKLELLQVKTGSKKFFSEAWYEDGERRQNEFIEAYRKVGDLIRERLASLGIVQQ